MNIFIPKASFEAQKIFVFHMTVRHFLTILPLIEVDYLLKSVLYRKRG